MRVAEKIELSIRGPYNRRPSSLDLKDDEGDVMASIPLKELAKALAPFLTVQPIDVCSSCDGRCVEDAHNFGDGAGGPCRECAGTGVGD